MPRDRLEIHRSLLAKGFELEQKGRDHDYYFLRDEGLTRAVFTKMSRGSKHREIGDGLLGRMCRQLQLTRGEFDQLIDCPLSGTDYLARLVERGVIDAS